MANPIAKTIGSLGKIIAKSVHKILDMNNLDIFYKKLLYLLQGQSTTQIEQITKSI